MGGFRTRAGLEPAPTVDGACDRSHCHTGDVSNAGGKGLCIVYFRFDITRNRCGVVRGASFRPLTMSVIGAEVWLALSELVWMGIAERVSDIIPVGYSWYDKASDQYR